MKIKSVKKIFILSALLVYLMGCNKKKSVLNNFNSLVAESNRIIIRFTSNEHSNTNPLIKVIYKIPVIDEFKELMQQTEDRSNCNYIDGTMAFFKDSTKKAYLEFSINPDCPAFYLHHSDKVTQYKMPVFFAMFLQSIRQGEK